MNEPIYYAEMPIPQPGPVWVLMQGGLWQVPPSERPADWREREKPREYAETRRDVPVQLGQLRVPARTIVSHAPKLPKLPAKRKPRPPAGNPKGRPRKRPPLDVLLNHFREGMSSKQIAAKYNIHFDNLGSQIGQARREHPEFRAAYDGMKACKCGRVKWPQVPLCGSCARVIRKREQRAAAKAAKASVA